MRHFVRGAAKSSKCWVILLLDVRVYSIRLDSNHGKKVPMGRDFPAIAHHPDHASDLTDPGPDHSTTQHSTAQHSKALVTRKEGKKGKVGHINRSSGGRKVLCLPSVPTLWSSLPKPS